MTERSSLLSAKTEQCFLRWFAERENVMKHYETQLVTTSTIGSLGFSSECSTTFGREHFKVCMENELLNNASCQTTHI